MLYGFIRHKVKDYIPWRKYFDNDDARRRASGMRVQKVFKAHDDPNIVAFYFELDSAEGMDKLMQDPKMKDILEKAGVLSAPEAFIFDEAA